MFYYPPGGVSVVAVEDVVNGMVKAMEKGRSAERYILAGENMTLKDLFHRIADEAGVNRAWLPLPGCVLQCIAGLDENLSKIGLKGPLSSERAYVAMMYHWYDSTKARQELGFSTRPAQQAIANSVQWMSQRGLLRK
jgi:dihydroflavonol-4-reductase